MESEMDLLGRYAEYLNRHYDVNVSIRDDGLFVVTHEVTGRSVLSGSNFSQYQFVEMEEVWNIVGKKCFMYEDFTLGVPISLYTSLICVEGI